MSKEKGRIILIICMAIEIISVLAFIIVRTAEERKNENEIVETYENSLDEISVTYDDDNHLYDVFVNNQHYFISDTEIKVLPYYKNEVYVEITRNGKCYLYFFIKVDFESN